MLSDFPLPSLIAIAPEIGLTVVLVLVLAAERVFPPDQRRQSGGI